MMKNLLPTWLAVALSLLAPRTSTSQESDALQWIQSQTPSLRTTVTTSDGRAYNKERLIKITKAGGGKILIRTSSLRKEDPARGRDASIEAFVFEGTFTPRDVVLPLVLRDLPNLYYGGSLAEKKSGKQVLIVLSQSAHLSTCTASLQLDRRRGPILNDRPDPSLGAVSELDAQQLAEAALENGKCVRTEDSNVNSISIPVSTGDLAQSVMSRLDGELRRQGAKAGRSRNVQSMDPAQR